eukprot:TRINITY_DN18288_c0_g1_i2.p1 TRINITY_DN18288_c0_g1~~TRINITY_DN18288_c0_g1_i2.p1  ORF type:complete len:753 (+),score=216.99 TRINITY_DN18288_c0_g1_i2:94-2352(+)
MTVEARGQPTTAGSVGLAAGAGGGGGGGGCHGGSRSAANAAAAVAAAQGAAAAVAAAVNAATVARQLSETSAFGGQGGGSAASDVRKQAARATAGQPGGSVSLASGGQQPQPPPPPSVVAVAQVAALSANGRGSSFSPGPRKATAPRSGPGMMSPPRTAAEKPRGSTAQVAGNGGYVPAGASQPQQKAGGRRSAMRGEPVRRVSAPTAALKMSPSRGVPEAAVATTEGGLAHAVAAVVLDKPRERLASSPSRRGGGGGHEDGSGRQQLPTSPLRGSRSIRDAGVDRPLVQRNATSPGTQTAVVRRSLPAPAAPRGVAADFPGSGGGSAIGSPLTGSSPASSSRALAGGAATPTGGAAAAAAAAAKGGGLAAVVNCKVAGREQLVAKIATARHRAAAATAAATAAADARGQALEIYAECVDIRWRLWSQANKGVLTAAAGGGANAPAAATAAAAIDVPNATPMGPLHPQFAGFAAQLLLERDQAAREAERCAAALAKAHEALGQPPAPKDEGQRSTEVTSPTEATGGKGGGSLSKAEEGGCPEGVEAAAAGVVAAAAAAPVAARAPLLQEGGDTKEALAEKASALETEVASWQTLCEQLAEELSCMHKAHAQSVADATEAKRGRTSLEEALEKAESHAKALASENAELKRRNATLLQQGLVDTQAAYNGGMAVPRGGAISASGKKPGGTASPPRRSGAAALGGPAATAPAMDAISDPGQAQGASNGGRRGVSPSANQRGGAITPTAPRSPTLR